MFLKNKKFLKWVKEGITKITLVHTKTVNKLKPYAKIEREWGNSMIGKVNNNQWSTKICEGSVEELLKELNYKNVRKPKFLRGESGKIYKPDLECDDFVWEVKGRSWTTTGTAGEKILGTPLKYSEIPKLYGKPLRVVCVGYQEWEARNGFACGNLIEPKERGTEELARILILLNKLDIEYVGFTDLLEKLHNKK